MLSIKMKWDEIIDRKIIVSDRMWSDLEPWIRQPGQVIRCSNQQGKNGRTLTQDPSCRLDQISDWNSPAIDKKITD